MDIRELTNEIKRELSEMHDNSSEYELLKQLLLDDKEVKITADTEIEQGTWDHVDPSTYSADLVDGRLQGYAYIDETEDGQFFYDFHGSYLEQVYTGPDEDGYPDYDYVDTGDTLSQKGEPTTKEQAVEQLVEFLKNVCDWLEVEEA